MAIRKIPQRKCIGCNESKDKRELLRVVRSPDGDISIDATGKKAGRGEYICKDTKCLALAKKGKRLEKAFDTTISEEIYSKLAQGIKDGE